ncbi:trihelix transcription factor DF1-like [Rutidosis leptorrhynchoides]|uniref:trihelix transcription factor DF1-like n=1 Tax=Rutidosis leptorrhynchoides TaxID=125765 RepID=UPI003A998C93
MELSSALPGNFGSNEEVREEGDRLFPGNRWPQQETLALLQIRSDMDAAFRGSGIKGPLWEQVSRKMSELGYNRNAKKCKEKFENLFKYHKRTKQFRTAKSNGKMYRFFEQLEAIDCQHKQSSAPLSPSSHATTMPMAVNPLSVVPGTFPYSIQKYISTSLDTSTDTASTSSKESERTRNKKRKLVGFFDKLMKEVVEKQEDLQRKFIEALEKCEQERISREEAWKLQEMARIERERQLLVQERSISAAKDAAVLAFLQKFSGSQFPEDPIIVPDSKVVERNERPERQERSNGESLMPMSSSRWPKEEMETLIRLRTNLNLQYEESGLKGSLWEEISAGMKILGYDRNAKRCKEKWENMNKYFRKVKDKNKKRPEDSKTCAYFTHLDALYKEKQSATKVDNSRNSSAEFKPEELLMHMMNAQEGQRLPESLTEDGESEESDQDGEDKHMDDHFHVVVNNPSSMAFMEIVFGACKVYTVYKLEMLLSY